MANRDDLAALEAENIRLIALLEAHDIEWRLPAPAAPGVQETEPHRLSTSRAIVPTRHTPPQNIVHLHSLTRPLFTAAESV